MSRLRQLEGIHIIFLFCLLIKMDQESFGPCWEETLEEGLQQLEAVFALCLVVVCQVVWYGTIDLAGSPTMYMYVLHMHVHIRMYVCRSNCFR
jgi:hypothetical protein